VRVAISLGLAAALFALFLSRAPLGQVLVEIRRVHLALLVASVAAALLGYLLRSLRWGLILRPVGRAPAADLWGCTAAGFAASTVLPARAGEVVRPALLSARTGLSLAGCLASIVTERLADAATVVACFGGGVLVAGDRVSAAWRGSLHSAALLVAAGLVMAFASAIVLLRLRVGAVARLSALAPLRFRPNVRAFLDHLLDGLAVIRDPARLLELAAWSALTWAMITCQTWLLLRAFDIVLGPAEVLIMIAVSVLGLAVPTPGGVGGFHAAVQFALVQILSVPVASASAFALVHHAVCFFPITIAGLWYVASHGLSMRRVAEAESTQGEAGGPA